MEETCEVFTCKNTDPGQLRRSVSEDSEIRQRVRILLCVSHQEKGDGHKYTLL